MSQLGISFAFMLLKIIENIETMRMAIKISALPEGWKYHIRQKWSNLKLNHKNQHRMIFPMLDDEEKRKKPTGNFMQFILL